MVPTHSRISTAPIIDSAMSASRTTGRLTPSFSARSRSETSLSPGWITPSSSKRLGGRGTIRIFRWGERDSCGERVGRPVKRACEARL